MGSYLVFRCCISNEDSTLGYAPTWGLCSPIPLENGAGAEAEGEKAAPSPTSPTACLLLGVSLVASAPARRYPDMRLLLLLYLCLVHVAV